MSSEVSNIYLNLSTSSINTDILSFSTTFTNPIIKNSRDYYCSLIRFNLPMQAVPLTIIPIVPNQGNANLTTLVVGIQYGSATPGDPAASYYTQQVIFVPGDNVNPAPIQNQPTQVITPYYFYYGLEKTLNIINTALAGVVAAFKTANPSAPQVSGSFANDVPYMIYNSTTQLVGIIAGAPWARNYTGLTGATTAFIYVNNAMVQFTDTMHFFQTGTGIVNQYNFYFDLWYSTFSQIYLAGDPQSTTTGGNTSLVNSNHIVRYQDFQTPASWISVSKIIITTNLPVAQEFVQTQNISNISQQSILTDFVLNVDSFTSAKNEIVYNPTSQYRLLDIISDAPINSLTFSIYWQDDQLNIYPLYIPFFSEANLKIGFFKKSLYNTKDEIYNDILRELQREQGKLTKKM